MYTNIWTTEGWKVIPTNLNTNYKGEAIMGAGLALEAATRNPQLSLLYGKFLTEGNKGIYLTSNQLILFPTKEDWKKPSSLKLIANSAGELSYLIKNQTCNGLILMPQVGCGLGKLKWTEVKPMLEIIFKEVSEKIIYLD